MRISPESFRQIERDCFHIFFYQTTSAMPKLQHFLQIHKVKSAAVQHKVA